MKFHAKNTIIHTWQKYFQESGDDEFSEVDEDSPPRSKKSRRDADLPKKTKKKSQPGNDFISFCLNE